MVSTKDNLGRVRPVHLLSQISFLGTLLVSGLEQRTVPERLAEGWRWTCTVLFCDSAVTFPRLLDFCVVRTFPLCCATDL